MKKVSDCVVKYRELGFNCAESTLMACNEAWDLGLSEEQMLVMGGFGSGMGVKDVCGAVTGGIAGLSVKYAVNTGHESPLLMKKVQTYVEQIQKEIGHIHCRELAPLYQFTNPVIGCAHTCQLLTAVLDQVDAMPMEDVPMHRTMGIHAVGVQAALSDPRWVIVDCREPELYTGAVCEENGLCGHIPSAISFPYSLLRELTPEQAAGMLEEKGITKDKYVCVYEYAPADGFAFTETMYKLGYTHNCRVFDLKLWTKELIKE